MTVILKFVVRPDPDLPDRMQGYVRGETEQHAKSEAPEGALFFPFDDLWPSPKDAHIAVLTR